MHENTNYYCYVCKFTFTLPKVEIERETGAVICSCCRCGSEDICLVSFCSRCGKIREIEERAEISLCRACTSEVKNRFQNLLQHHFSPEERQLLNRLYDGVYF